jgi:NAD(P)-dependent dehydrogenase (short-subunit alcohol dehydrogenase family)
VARLYESRLLQRVAGRIVKEGARLERVAPNIKVTRQNKSLVVTAPEDIAGMVVFLASNDAANVTSAELVVDGRYTAV